MENQIKQFLATLNPSLCVVSTVTPDGKSQSAVMAFAVRDDLSVVISTHKDSRKWQNMLHNNHVSLIFGWSFSTLNVQYEGEAELIQSGNDFVKEEAFFFEKHPETKVFKSDSTVYIRVKPTWVRLTDMTVQPMRIEETRM